MATQNVFAPTGFSLTELTAAINGLPHKPTQLGDSGLFSYDGVTTLSMQIERQDAVLSLVPTSPRGAPGKPIGRDTRNSRSFILPHLQLEDAVRADEVQGVRLFGTENQLTPFQTRLMRVMQLGVDRLDYTMEFQRVGALKGIVYDSDGSTVLFNLFTEFGVSQTTANMTLSSATTNIRVEVDKWTNTIDDLLGGIGYEGLDVWCGRTAWQSLVSHKSYLETFAASPDVGKMRAPVGNVIEFGGATWHKYRGRANSAAMIADAEMYVVPRGVSDLFIGRFGPADYEDTVNTMGLPMYAQGLRMRNGKGWDIEMQSNPIHLCTRPDAVIKITVN